MMRVKRATLLDLSILWTISSIPWLRLYPQDGARQGILSDMNRCKERSYPTVFSHGDLAPRNIPLKDGRIVAVVDWGFSGWYPAYWDYTRTFFSNLQFPEWWEAFQTVMEPFKDELEMERSLWTVFVRIGL